MTIPHITFLFNRHPVKPVAVPIGDHCTHPTTTNDINNNNNGHGRSASTVTSALAQPSTTQAKAERQPSTATTNNDGMTRGMGWLGCGGQKWHIVGFNSAPVLHALQCEDESEEGVEGENAENHILNGSKNNFALQTERDINCSVQELFKEFQECQHNRQPTAIAEKAPPGTLDQPKRARKKTIPPLDYVCKLCSKTGHWMEDCDYYRPHTIVLHTNRPPSSSSDNHPNQGDQKVTNSDIPPPPPNYLCRLCMVPGHWIDQCARFTPKCGTLTRTRSTRSPHHGR